MEYLTASDIDGFDADNEPGYKPPRPPKGLGPAGRKLWKAIVSDWQLRPDELAVLESVCFEADIIRRLQDEMVDSPLTAKGSMGQLVEHPVSVALRQHRATQAQLLKQLQIPDQDEDEAEETTTFRRKPMSRSEAAKKAANARWRKR